MERARQAILGGGCNEAMRLPRGYRSVLATFEEGKGARAAAGELKALGLERVQVDRISPPPLEDVGRVSQPLSGGMESLASLTLGTDVDSPDQGVAMAADPSASGLAQGPAAQRAEFLLTALVRTEQVEQALEVVRRHGGRA